MRAACAVLAALLGGAAANPNQFEAVSPGGDTLCFKGGEFSFMHRAGTVKKLVVELEGGGACWSAATCGVGSCTQSVNKQGKVNSLNKGGGIHSGSNAKNAFAEWYHVFVPYCGCDIHSGNNDMKYTINTVHHRGHVNFMSALNWTLANFPTDMEVVTTTGCSAGSAGAFINWPYVSNAYPAAKHYTFGDSYIGVFAEKQWNQCYKNWKIQVPTFVPGVSDDTLSTWYDGISCYVQEMGAKWAPDATVGWYTSNADAVQTSFYALGGGSPLGWTKAMRSLAACYNANTTAVHTFIAKGDAHCRSQDDGYFSVTADGVNLAEWVGSIVGGARDVGSPDCAADGECSAADVAAAAPLDLKGYAGRLPYKAGDCDPATCHGDCKVDGVMNHGQLTCVNGACDCLV